MQISKKIRGIFVVSLSLLFVLSNQQGCSDVGFSSASEVDPVQRNCADDAIADDGCIIENPGEETDLTPELVSHTTIVPPALDKADILFVIDNSGSMTPQLAKLVNKFPLFINTLAGLDWQLCVTTTDGVGNSQGEGGHLIRFDNGEYWINSSTSNPQQRFENLLDNLNKGASDERGILAINRSVSLNHGCFRSGASLSTVIVSDEDERSTGGYDQYINDSQYKVLQSNDYPSALLEKIANEFAGENKNYTNHSIVIQPNDISCFNNQANEGYKAYYGTWYSSLTQQTGGIQGDLCSSDYGSQLSFIGNKIVNTLDSIALECSPVDSGGAEFTNANDIIVSINPATATAATLDANKISFSPALVEGTEVQLSYYCLRQ